MSTNVGSIHYDVKLNTTDFDRKVATIGAKTQALGRKMSDIGKTMTVGLTLPIVAGAALAVKSASDLNENINKVEVAFKKSAKAVLEWSKTSIQSMGLAKSSALEAVSLFGDMATSMGFNNREAAKMSMTLVQLAADLSSFKNINIAEAQTALAGVFTGETESLKRLGIVMTEVNLLEFAKAKGIKKTIQEMTQAEKVQLRFNYIMAKTKNAQGDFIRTSGGTANQIRITQEKFKELSATIGIQLLPIANKVLGTIQDILEKFTNLTPKQQDVLLKFLGITAVLGPLLIILGKLVSAVGVLIPLLANPVFLAITVALLAIAGAVYLVWKNWDKLKPLIITFWNTIKPFRDFIVNQFKKAWDDLTASLNQVMSALRPYMPQLQALAKFIGVVVLAVIASFIAGLALLAVAIARVVGWIVKIGSAINTFAIRAYKDTVYFWQGFHRMVQMIILSISNLVRNFTYLKNKIISVFAGAGSWLYNAGRNIVDGLVKGITSKISSVYNTLKNGLSNAVKGVKSFLGIQSPSKMFMNIGDNMAKGMALGLQKNMKLVTGSSALMAYNAGNAANNTTTSIYGNINIANQSDADYFMAKLTRNQELAFRSIATRPGAVG